MHFINGIYVQKYDANGAVGEKVYVSFGTDDPNGKGVLVKTAATEHQGEKWVYTVPNNDAGHNYKYVITYAVVFYNYSFIILFDYSSCDISVQILSPSFIVLL